MTKFNEDSRVKIPAILHLVRLGYSYLSLKKSQWDPDTNIFPEVFVSALKRINPTADESELLRLKDEVSLLLENEDLGKAFYERLIEKSGLRLIDFEDFSRNTFNVVTELPCQNKDEEFRPDITILINGMPLAFIEVKKPNNKEGVLAERKRIKTRFQNSKFRKFVNITQLMIFSNNMEYDDGSPEPIEGAFYATTSYSDPVFNYFRDEEDLSRTVQLLPAGNAQEDEVLKDNNLAVIKHSPEFVTNKASTTPTNRICTSIFEHGRIEFLLRYALAYVDEDDGLQKHVMRYPQVFATKAIEKAIDGGTKKGIIWHTQGSGKTALAYFNVRHLTDYFAQKAVVPKFYFIVDRLDLLIQAQREFQARGLTVRTINSRSDFATDIKSNKAIHNDQGLPEITVVNIQKFQDDPEVGKASDYDLSVQRVFFLDEVHRSYNPKGSFLANLTLADPNAIKLGLTGTPLLGNDYDSKSIFGDYIHKYYYNASIADGYTLRLIREEISSNYKLVMQQALDEVEVAVGTIDKKAIYAHEQFVEPMLAYIIDDLRRSRIAFGVPSIGAMVICDSSDQAKQMEVEFQSTFATNEFTSALILHDVGNKESRKNQVEEFKAGKIDILFVYNMLLTGFDAKRLKKLYLGRVIKRHNLLQALTRVNRTYKDMRYGFVVDFADIRKEFDATNKAYFDELKAELGDEMEKYSDLFKSRDEIEQEIEDIKDQLFRFDLANAEVFSQQISEIQDRKQVQQIKQTLDNAKSLYNLIRLLGHFDVLEQLDFKKISVLYREVSNHLDLLNLKENVENSDASTNLLNSALEDVVFMFSKIGEEELVLADELKDTLRKTREALAGNYDQKDPEFVSLRDELERLFKQKKLSEVDQETMNANIGSLNKIHGRIKELNRQNEQLRAKYGNDKKYVRVHKRLLEHGGVSESERRIFDALEGVKAKADIVVLENSQVVRNETFFEQTMMPSVIEEFRSKQKIKINPDVSRFINGLVTREYLEEFKAGA
ncbi:Type-1 restriction enzyme R protein [Ascidiaceihabitans donghaensis]|uniref:type I site-specific deoxyribonuclease n=1 Tax=Ascidiaceihabitans donghaensis TaxID=1510460 RepID=A0A2R8BB97_9RHOB|nr:type I restriction endonuclease [Ascidiaceihabitans donghaensis]SPH20338.1 Type-1 restriction enzyme R protein [Ascidiaceihabitans donghaensis]